MAQVKGVKVSINTKEIEKLFKLPFIGISYTYDETSKFKMLNLNTIILWFMEDPIGEKKLPWKTNFLKVKCRVMLYMLTRILFP